MKLCNLQYKREHFQEIASTNDYAKAIRSKRENVIVSADVQTGGRGTKGRSFSSAKGGVYVSKLTFYDGFPASRAFEIMKGAATAVCETLVFFGLQPKIKWPNDVFVDGKKICGILIENSLSGGDVGSSIVGVGLNVHNVLPQELTKIATTMQLQLGKKLSVEEVRETLIHYLCADKIGERYEQYLGWLGEKAELILGEQRFPVTLQSVDDEGGLWVEMQGEHRRFLAAEVSIFVKEE
jgi:BirA family biotin operon repressor/biotin-[acetyl-CoA-carboxylase] ligase